MVVKLRGILTNGEGEIGNHSSFDVGAVDLGDNVSKLSKTVWTEDRSSVTVGAVDWEVHASNILLRKPIQYCTYMLLGRDNNFLAEYTKKQKSISDFYIRFC